MTRLHYDIITQWQNATFSKSTPLSCAKHLQEEARELMESIEAGKPDKQEIADCFLLLIGVCNKLGMTYEDVVAAIEDKMDVNFERSWGEPNEDGYVKHIDEPITTAP